MDFIKKNSQSLLLALLCLGGAFFAGYQIGGINAVKPVEGAYNMTPPGAAPVDFTPFWKAWNVINEKYVPTATTSTEVSNEDKLWGSIAGLADSLNDPYTQFLPPSDNAIFESDISGNFEGVGMEIGVRDDILTVIAPLKGTPAEKAGIQSGDKVLAINGTSTAKMSSDEAVKLIRGKKGSEVKFTIFREGSTEPIEIPVIRDVIDIPTIDAQLMDNGVFKIELYNFSAVSANLFRNALREFKQSGSDKLILDLRGNPGGYLDASIDMASWFLPAGKVVLQEDFGGRGDPKLYRSKGYNIFNDRLKFVILVNRGSASASEILAGALREYGVATLVGEKTFGKGSVQELVDITPDTSLKVTIARWLTPNGVSISANGLEPDIAVERTAEDFAAGKDPQLDKAIEILTK